MLCKEKYLRGSVRIQIPLEVAETLSGLIDGVIGNSRDDELNRQLSIVLKRLDKQCDKQWKQCDKQMETHEPKLDAQHHP